MEIMLKNFYYQFNFNHYLTTIPSLPFLCMPRLLSVQSRATEVLQVHQSTVTAFGADAINAASSLLDQLVESNTAYKASIK